MRIRHYLTIFIIICFAFSYPSGAYSQNSYIPHSFNSEWNFKGKVIGTPEAGDVYLTGKVNMFNDDTNEYTILEEISFQGKLVQQSYSTFVDKGDIIQLISRKIIRGGRTLEILFYPPLINFKIPIISGDSWKERVKCSVNGKAAIIESNVKVLGTEKLFFQPVGNVTCWRIESTRKIIFEDMPDSEGHATLWFAPYLGTLKMINDFAENTTDPLLPHAMEFTLTDYKIF